MQFGAQAEKTEPTIIDFISKKCPRLLGAFSGALSVAAILAFTPFPSQAIEECTNEKLDAFRGAAQSQSDETESKFKALIDCPGFRSELLLWLNYYHRSRGDYSSGDDELSKASEAAQSERDQLISKANRGQTQDIQNAVDEKSSAYAVDGEMLLILARALTREGDYEAGRSYYKRYLALKPDDTEIEVEYAYTYLWSGETAHAEKSLKELLARAKTPEQSRAAREGLKSLKSMAPKSFEELIDRSSHFSLGFERANNNFFNFTRSTSYVGYSANKWNLGVASHFLTSSNYPSAFGLEGSASRSFNVSQSVGLYTKLGYFNAGQKGVPIIGLLLNRQTKSGLVPGIGFYNEPLIRDVPLPTKGQDWYRSAAFFKLNFKQLLEYHLELRSISSNTNSTEHFFKVNIPLKKNDAGNFPFQLYLLGETESFTKSSAYVYSPNSYTSLRVGGQYAELMTDELDLKLKIEYGPYYESSRQAGVLTYGSASTTLGLGGEFNYKLEEDFFFDFRIRFDRTESDTSGTTYASTLFGVNLVWLLGKSP